MFRGACLWLLVGNAASALRAFGQVAVERLRARSSGAVGTTGHTGPRNGGEVVAGERGVAPDAHRITSSALREARNRDDVGAGLRESSGRRDDRKKSDSESRQGSA